MDSLDSLFQHRPLPKKKMVGCHPPVIKKQTHQIDLFRAKVMLFFQKGTLLWWFCRSFRSSRRGWKGDKLSKWASNSRTRFGSCGRKHLQWTVSFYSLGNIPCCQTGEKLFREISARFFLVWRTHFGALNGPVSIWRNTENTLKARWVRHILKNNSMGGKMQELQQLSHWVHLITFR